MKRLEKFENKRMNVRESKHINGGGTSGLGGQCGFAGGGTHCATATYTMTGGHSCGCPSKYPYNHNMVLAGINFSKCGWGSNCTKCKYVTDTSCCSTANCMG
ncbi:MAG: hypothetical protein ACPGJS_06200 [Flammeovirgaceae bacterium]